MTELQQQQTTPERYTLRGKPEVEQRIASDMEKIVEHLRGEFSGDSLQAIVLLGGYGRGEGGALMEHGRPKPHNNYDLLVLIEKMPLSRRKAYFHRATTAGRTLAKIVDLGVDVNIRPVAFLDNAVHILINHDLRFGHHVLWGDLNILARMPEYDKTDVPLSEGAALLRNRGNCLLENRMALEVGQNYREDERRKFIRHIFKATIGYGDAVLIAKGWYDTSYATKLERIINLDIQEVPRAELLKAIYKEAAEFRFEPNYAKYMERDYTDWLMSVLSVLEPIHLWFEKQRLGVEELTWQTQYHQVTAEGFGTLEGPLKRVRDFLINFREFGALDALGDRGWWFLRHPRDRMLAAFPALLYRPADWEWKKEINPLLGVRGDWIDAARRYQELYKKYLT